MVRARALWGDVWPPAIWILGLLAAWEAAAIAFRIPDYLLPVPSAIAARLATDWPILLRQGAKTTLLILEGFAAGAIPGAIVGWAVAHSRTLERALTPLIVLVQSTPQISVAPLLIVWFGYGDAPKVILTAVLTFFPVMVDGATGFRSVDRRLTHVTRSMGAGWWQALRAVELPQALPYLFAGCRVSLLTAVTVIVVVEFVSSNEGLGFVAVRALANQDLSLMFAAVVVAIAIGLLLNYAVEAVEALSMPWRRWRAHAH
jgi:NitT/TauT family transport system permease protein